MKEQLINEQLNEPGVNDIWDRGYLHQGYTTEQILRVDPAVFELLRWHALKVQDSLETHSV